MAYSSSRFQDDSQAAEVVRDGIEAVWNSTSASIDQRWLASLEIPLATDMAMLKISKLVAWAMIEHDGVVAAPVVAVAEDASSNTNAEQQEATLTPLEYYVADDEPTRSAIDTWARGTVPVRKPEDPSSDLYHSNEKSEKTPSVSSFRTSNSGATAKTSNSRTSAVSMKSRGASGGGRRGMEEEDDPTGQIVELDDPDDEFAELNGNGMLFEHLSKMKKQKSTVAEAEDVKGEFELLQEGINNQLKDLKTKKYAIDATGKVIPLQPVKAESLPPYAVPLETSINSPRAATGARSSSASGQDKRKKKIIRVAGSRTIDDESLFKPSNTLATVLSTGEQISLQAGVNLKVGNNTRDGPSIPDNPNKLSRKQYLARATAAPESRANTKGSPTFDLENTMSTVGTVEYESSGFGAGLPQSMHSTHSVRFPDIDALEGGRRLLSQQELAALQEISPSDEEIGLGPKTTTGQVQPYVLAKKKDPSAQLFDHDTSKTGLPKDRDLPINQRLPSERKHQLAPPPGKVSVHQEGSNKQQSVNSPAGSVAGSHNGGTSVNGSPSKLLKPTTKIVRPELAKALF